MNTHHSAIASIIMEAINVRLVKMFERCKNFVVYLSLAFEKLFRSSPPKNFS